MRYGGQLVFSHPLNSCALQFSFNLIPKKSCTLVHPLSFACGPVAALIYIRMGEETHLQLPLLIALIYMRRLGLCPSLSKVLGSFLLLFVLTCGVAEGVGGWAMALLVGLMGGRWWRR